MAINVTCPSCLTRFTVGDKFAGKQGPCPKCKGVITIPQASEQVVIHSPEHSEAGAVGAGGRHSLKTYRRQDTKFKPIVFSVVAGVVLLTILGALVLRSNLDPQTKSIVTIASAIVLGPPVAWAGYTFLRDDELEGYNGKALLIRAAICGLVYALLWGVYWFVGQKMFGPEAFTKGMEIWQMAALLIPIMAVGAGAAYVSFDIDPGSGFFHCAMYFAVTILLRLVAGMPAVPGLVLGS